MKKILLAAVAALAVHGAAHADPVYGLLANGQTKTIAVACGREQDATMAAAIARWNAFAAAAQGSVDWKLGPDGVTFLGLSGPFLILLTPDEDACRRAQNMLMNKFGIAAPR